MVIVSSVQDAILSTVFPQACHVCLAKVRRSRFGVACSDCWSQTKFFDPAKIQCVKCGRFSDIRSATTDCPTCRDHHYDLARSLGVYEKAMSASILHLKRMPVIAPIVLERFMSILSTTDFADTEVAIPVPLSKNRYLERGFNQAEILAAAAAQTLRISMDSNSLARKKHTPMHRAAMDKKAREVTVANAFEVTRRNLIEGKSILLVDDIFTSGATVSNCAKALRKKGAAKVKVFTLARALR